PTRLDEKRRRASFYENRKYARRLFTLDGAGDRAAPGPARTLPDRCDRSAGWMAARAPPTAVRATTRAWSRRSCRSGRPRAPPGPATCRPAASAVPTPAREAPDRTGRRPPAGCDPGGHELPA